MSPSATSAAYTSLVSDTTSTIGLHPRSWRSSRSGTQVEDPLRVFKGRSFAGRFLGVPASRVLPTGYVWLVVIAVVNIVTSAYYYQRPIVAMYTGTGGAEVARMRLRPALVAAIAIAVIATIMIGIYPQPYMAASTSAFTSAFGIPPLSTTASLLP